VSAVRRVDVPSGTVPALRDFIKHVWRYRDENGHTVLCAPPEVFTLVLDDKDEADQAVTAAALLSNAMGFGDRVSSHFKGPLVLVTFRDLQALHAFLKVISLHVGHEPSREVAAFAMSMLGFRWT
jgi:hypothetical protein